VIGQIVLGGITVLVDLNPFAVASHMLLSQAIVACAVVLVKRAGEPDGPRRPVVTPVTRRLVWALGIATGAAIVAGTVVTGAGPHAGSEDVGRFDVQITDAARTHSSLVLIAVALAIFVAVRIQRAHRWHGNLGQAALPASLAQQVLWPEYRWCVVGLACHRASSDLVVTSDHTVRPLFRWRGRTRCGRTRCTMRCSS